MQHVALHLQHYVAFATLVLSDVSVKVTRYVEYNL